jgi:hypothetical protein
MFLTQDHLENISGLQRKRIKNRKRRRKGLEFEKEKEKEKLLPSLGWADFQPSSRAPAFPPPPLFPAQAAQSSRRSLPLTPGPRPSAPHPSLSRRFLSLAARAHSSAPSPSPIPHRRVRRRVPPRLVASPLMLASLRHNPATVLEPTSHPLSLPEPSQSALAPFPPSWRARRCSPSPPSPSLPRAPIKGPARAPSSPHNSSHPHCPPPRAIQANAAVLPSPLR